MSSCPPPSPRYGAALVRGRWRDSVEAARNAKNYAKKKLKYFIKVNKNRRAFKIYFTAENKKYSRIFHGIPSLFKWRRHTAPIKINGVMSNFPLSQILY